MNSTHTQMHPSVASTMYSDETDGTHDIEDMPCLTTEAHPASDGEQSIPTTNDSPDVERGSAFACKTADELHHAMKRSSHMVGPGCDLSDDEKMERCLADQQATQKTRVALVMGLVVLLVTIFISVLLMAYFSCNQEQTNSDNELN
ncbi:hypothetical protein MPSEU_000106000 [Mayamaea pseudoterrestris]|nr:hypothetical protein MPSEU_000106000 [Mayamaea pseudoterrestris]